MAKKREVQVYAEYSKVEYGLDEHAKLKKEITDRGYELLQSNRDPDGTNCWYIFRDDSRFIKAYSRLDFEAYLNARPTSYIDTIKL